MNIVEIRNKVSVCAKNAIDKKIRNNDMFADSRYYINIDDISSWLNAIDECIEYLKNDSIVTELINFKSDVNGKISNLSTISLEEFNAMELKFQGIFES